MKLNIFLLCLTALPLASCGGGAGCLGATEITEQATLASRSADTLGKTIEFCVGGDHPGKTAVELTEDSYSDPRVLVLSIRHEDNDQGPRHWDGACNDMDRSQHPKLVAENVSIALTSESIKTMKLCYFDSTKNVVALSTVGENQDCPAGSVAQTVPVDDCTTLPKSPKLIK